MPPPSEQKIRAAIDAIRRDASMWDESADELEDAARVAGRLDLAAVHFSYIGDKVGLVDMYRQLQDKLIRLLNEGSDTLESIAAALRTAADGYEQDEANAVHRTNNIY